MLAVRTSIWRSRPLSSCSWSSAISYLYGSASSVADADMKSLITKNTKVAADFVLCFFELQAEHGTEGIERCKESDIVSVARLLEIRGFDIMRIGS